MRPSGTHLYKRVCPSVCRSDGPLRLCENRISRLFWPQWDPPLTLNVLSASFTTLSFHLSDRPSVSLYISHVQYTQRHSPDASLPGRACWKLVKKNKAERLPYSRGHATLHLVVSFVRSVRRSVTNVFELRAVFALWPLPNCPRLSWRVSGLVRYHLELYLLYSLIDVAFRWRHF